MKVANPKIEKSVSKCLILSVVLEVKAIIFFVRIYLPILFIIILICF